MAITRITGPSVSNVMLNGVSNSAYSFLLDLGSATPVTTDLIITPVNGVLPGEIQWRISGGPLMDLSRVGNKEDFGNWRTFGFDPEEGVLTDWIPDSKTSFPVVIYVPNTKASAGTPFTATIIEHDFRKASENVTDPPGETIASFAAPVAPPDPSIAFDVIASGLEWDSKNGGLKFSYEVKNATQRKIGLSPYLSLEKDGKEIVITNSTLSTTSNGVKTLQVPGNILYQNYSASPYKATIKFSGLGAGPFTDANPANNIKTAADVVINNQAPLGAPSPFSLNRIAYGLRMVGSSQASITSVTHKVDDIIGAMYSSIRSKGAKSQLDLYSSAGDSVINAYVDSLTGVALPGGARIAKASLLAPHDKLGLTPALVSKAKSAMLQAANKVGPWNLSRHIADPNRRPQLQAIDLAPSSFTAGTSQRFVNALTSQKWLAFSSQPATASMNSILPPGVEPGFHLEINQSF